MSGPLRVESIQHLKELSREKLTDFFIWFGVAKSSKTILYSEELDEFYIFNDIDGTDQDVKTKDLKKCTNIAESIKNKCFYKY